MSDDAVQALMRALDYFAALDGGSRSGYHRLYVRPLRWYYGGKSRCINGHVFLDSQETLVNLDQVCRWCSGFGYRTFPEDEDGALLIMGTNVTQGVCEFDVTLSGEYGFNTGRPRYRVLCKTCDVLVHESTTSPSSAKERHMRYGV